MATSSLCAGFSCSCQHQRSAWTRVNGIALYMATPLSQTLIFPSLPATGCGSEHPSVSEEEKGSIQTKDLWACEPLVEFLPWQQAGPQRIQREGKARPLLKPGTLARQPLLLVYPVCTRALRPVRGPEGCCLQRTVSALTQASQPLAGMLFLLLHPTSLQSWW